jgi:DNA-binding transcriptional MerR regulator
MARLTGLSVRTLHHYDQIGLLPVARRTDSGHRVYTEADLERLQRIVSLRELGFSLDEIRHGLDRPEYALLPLVGLHIQRLDTQLALQQQLRRRLEAVRTRLESGEYVPSSQFFEVMGAIHMLERYLTSDQVTTLQASHRQDAQQVAWKEMLAKLRALMEAGEAPTSPPVQALAAAWREASTRAEGHDQAFGDGLRKLLENEPAVRRRLGLDDAIWAYMQAAFPG